MRKEGKSSMVLPIIRSIGLTLRTTEYGFFLTHFAAAALALVG